MATAEVLRRRLGRVVAALAAAWRQQLGGSDKAVAVAVMRQHDGGGSGNGGGNVSLTAAQQLWQLGSNVARVLVSVC